MLKFILPIFILTTSCATKNSVKAPFKYGVKDFHLENLARESIIKSSDPELKSHITDFLFEAASANLSVASLVEVKSVRLIEPLPFEILLNENLRNGGENALAFASIERLDGIRSTKIYISKELLSRPIELKGLLFHELLHSIGFDHPVRSCSWDMDRCGILGKVPRKEISKADLKKVIDYSFTEKYLNSIRRLEFFSEPPLESLAH